MFSGLRWIFADGVVVYYFSEGISYEEFAGYRDGCKASTKECM